MVRSEVKLKVAVTSLKLEIRLHAQRLAQTHDLVPQQFLPSSDWLVRSEPGYYAHSLYISGSKRRRSNFKFYVLPEFNIPFQSVKCVGFNNMMWKAST